MLCPHLVTPVTLKKELSRPVRQRISPFSGLRCCSLWLSARGVPPALCQAPSLAIRAAIYSCTCRVQTLMGQYWAPSPLPTAGIALSRRPKAFSLWKGTPDRASGMIRTPGGQGLFPLPLGKGEGEGAPPRWSTNKRAQPSLLPAGQSFEAPAAPPPGSPGSPRPRDPRPPRRWGRGGPPKL